MRNMLADVLHCMGIDTLLCNQPHSVRALIRKAQSGTDSVWLSRETFLSPLETFLSQLSDKLVAKG